MRRFLVCLISLAVLTTACAKTTIPETEALVDTGEVGAIAAVPDGSVRYGERRTGSIFDVDAQGNRSAEPVARVEVSESAGGLLGMVVDESGRTFVSYKARDESLTVAQVLPAPQRVIWSEAGRDGGSISMTPQGRVLLALESQLVTLDADRNAPQLPNEISSGWNQIVDAAYAKSGGLWVIDRGQDGGDDRLARMGANGPIGDVRSLGDEREPVSLTAFGDQELVVCFRTTGKLQRFFLKDGVQTAPGRFIAGDCSGDGAEVKDGAVAYATANGIRLAAG